MSVSRTEEYHQTDTVLIGGQVKIHLHTGNLCVSNTEYGQCSAHFQGLLLSYFVRSMYERRYINHMMGIN
jgi:hypothetical protein